MGSRVVFLDMFVTFLCLWPSLGRPLGPLFQHWNLIRILVNSGTPRGEESTAGGNPPAPEKSDISEKIDVFVREWCIFFISGFRHPVREVTFSDVSEQLLCHCSIIPAGSFL